MAGKIQEKIFTARERYQRPHNYSILTALAGVPVCLAPRRQRTPVRSFLVQNDLDNGDWIRIRDSTTSLTNGLMLDPGAAWYFGVDDTGQRSAQILPTPAAFGTRMSIDRMEAAGLGVDTDIQFVLDIADFFVVANAATQRVQIFWSTYAK